MKKLLAILLGITMLFGMAVTGTAEAATGADVKGTGVPLTVYTNSGNSGRKEWLIERAKQDGFELAVHCGRCVRPECDHLERSDFP